jgi:hypothetical protein
MAPCKTDFSKLVKTLLENRRLVELYSRPLPKNLIQAP